MPNVTAADPLTRVLTRLERRRRGVALGGGLGVALAVAAVVGLAGIGLDLAFFLPHPVRWLVWGIWLGSIGLALAGAAFRAYARPADLLALASRAEHCDPAIGPLEALTASVSLSRRPNGSPALIAALAEQAAGVTGRIEPSRIIPGRRAVHRLAVGSCGLALFAAPAVLAPPGAVRTSVRRFLAPWINLGRAGAFQIIVEPGDGRAAIGSKPVVRVTVKNLKENMYANSESWLEWREDQTASRPHRLAMNDDGEAGRFSVALPRLNRDVSYRAVVSAGAGARSNGWGFDPTTSASPWYRLAAVEPPRVVGLRVTVEPPPGSGRPPSSTSVAAGESATIEAWRDGLLVFEVSTDARLRSLTVEFTAASTQPAAHPATVSPDRRTATATFRAVESGIIAISLVDDTGIVDSDESRHRLVVRSEATLTKLRNDNRENDKTKISTSREQSIKQRPASTVERRLDAARRAAARLRQEVERLRYAADSARQGNGAWDADRQTALAARENESRELIESLQRLASMLAGRTDPEAEFHALAATARDAAGREGESSRAALERARRLPPDVSDPAVRRGSPDPAVRRGSPDPAETASKRLDALRQADAHLAALSARLDMLQADVDAAKTKRQSGRGGDGRKADAASKDAQSRSENGDAKAARESAGAKPGEAGGGGRTAAGKPRAGRSVEPGKPGSGSSAPTGYPAAHEDAEPIPEPGAGDFAALRDALRGRSGRPWADLPGQLRSKILRMPQVRFRDEYSRQIERYYRALAEPAEAGDGKPDE